jgi:hypothetical protein
MQEREEGRRLAEQYAAEARLVEAQRREQKACTRAQQAEDLAQRKLAVRAGSARWLPAAPCGLAAGAATHHDCLQLATMLHAKM